MVLLTIQEASKWAAKKFKKDISPSNISYLIQYGKVKKRTQNGVTKISQEDLQNYYDSYHGKREVNWKSILGNDLNWGLSFDHLREKDTTKHVHRLHPYKGKFIPQLVEYFLDDHTDDFKKKSYFKKGDIILDPFLGSGTTLVQANELGMHGIGIDISEFNCIIAQSKLQEIDLGVLKTKLEDMKKNLREMEHKAFVREFDAALLQSLAEFNAKNFPSPEFKYRIEQHRLDEDAYARKKEKEFLPRYRSLVKKFKMRLRSSEKNSFLDIWYMETIRNELHTLFDFLNKERDRNLRHVLAVILSRTARSCRATTHSDLATLKEPKLETYYCYKHKKICKPLFSIQRLFEHYADDTLERLEEFSKLRTDAHSIIICGDSRTVDIAKALPKQRIQGIFSSPPYVGQIDYHEQHAYAYDLFKFERRDESEIGPLYKGQGKQARESYVEGIAQVLQNCKRFLAKDYDVFLVANDKWNLYPIIAEKAGMKIVETFKRPVLNRTERDRNPYSESIFHLREAE